jgi:hypothetical protein
MRAVPRPAAAVAIEWAPPQDKATGRSRAFLMAQITSGISSGCGKGAPGIEPGPSPAPHARTHAWKVPAEELRPMRPDIRLAAITRLGRLPAAIAARFACGMCAGWKEADGRFRLVSQQKQLAGILRERRDSNPRLRRDGSAPWFAVGFRRSPLVARCAGFPVPALPAFTTGCRRSVPRTFHAGSRGAYAAATRERICPTQRARGQETG